ncbi:MAG: 4-hydroxythreonine-4-phosphate dehydrogenase PdxA [Bacteroidia bacterium]
MSEHKIRVGITQGDINGVGMEIIIRTFLDPSILDLCTPVVYSSSKTASFWRKHLNVEDFSFNYIKEGEVPNQKRVNLQSCYEEEVVIEPGVSNALGGKYAVLSLMAAAAALDKGEIDVLVTAPIDKHNVQEEGFRFPGHTEFLQSRFGNPGSLMLLVSDSLRVGVVTGHMPLAQVSASITQEVIIEKIKLLNTTLIRDFGIRKPRIAVLGLNPHAGDQGTLGTEDKDIILPAVNKVKDQYILAWGPYPADGFFGNGSYLKFDAVLAMYHDQGLVPFKTISFGTGVNFTAGLRIVRTSPDHGTAYDIAGKNQASEESFRKAVYMACDIYRKRKEYQELTADPLKISILKKERS